MALQSVGLTLYTVGHGARSLDDFVAVVLDGGVARIVDVRRYPGSRRHPQFGRDALAAELPARGVQYEWRGDGLGGRRRPAEPTRHPEWRDDGFRGFADYMDTPEFADALRALLITGEAQPVAVMCAETLWWRCHRRLIADAAAAAGADVVHLIGVGKHQPHPAGLV